MTIVLGVGTGTFGILCADTRLNIRHAGGHAERNDEGVLTLARADGSMDIVPAKLRKMRTYQWGWAAAAGSSHLLNAAIFRRFEEEPVVSNGDIARIAGAVVTEQAEALRAEFTNAPAEDRVGITYLFTASGGVDLGKFQLGMREERDGQQAQFMLSLPPEASAESVAKFRNIVASQVFAPRSIQELLEVVRRTAAICAQAAEVLESVGPVIDVVIMAKQPNASLAEFQLHGDSRTIRAMPDLNLKAVLHRSK